MIHCITIAGLSSGLNYFFKDYNTNSPSKNKKFQNIVSLLCTILRGSKINIGKRVTFLEMENMSVTMAVDDEHAIFCAVFHDSGLV
jgi:hypothetical protein